MNDDDVEQYLIDHGFPVCPESALSVLCQFSMTRDNRLSGPMAEAIQNYILAGFWDDGTHGGPAVVRIGTPYRAERRAK